LRSLASYAGRVPNLKLSEAAGLPRLAVCRGQELRQVLPFRLATQHFFQEWNKAGAVASSAVMLGQPDQ
jgi:hypothetical protein